MMTMMKRKEKKLSFGQWMLSLQQWFVFVQRVEQVQVVTSDHLVLHLLLLLQLWTGLIGLTFSRHAARHQGGNTGAVAVLVHLGVNPTVRGEGASCADVFGHRGYLNGCYRHGDHHSVHFSNACFHLKYRKLWISDTTKHKLIILKL